MSSVTLPKLSTVVDGETFNRKNFYGRARLVLEANRRQLKPRFDPAELDRLLWEAAVNFHMDRRLVIGAFELLFDRRDIPDSNIVNYTLAHIRSGKTPDVYHHLQEIYGIGRKIASLWLRDVVMIWELESYLKNRIDLFCCQPIDTWIRQITTEMNIAPNKTPDKIRAMRIIAACEAENVSPLLFNAGAWMSGSEGSVSRR